MARLLGLVAAAVLIVVQSQPAAALTKTTATWTPMSPGPQLNWQGTAFAGSTCRLVSFGGTNGYQTFSSTSLFDPVSNTWATIAGTRSGPSARDLPQMAWYPATNRVVMFGGRSGGGGHAAFGALQDTWAFDPATKNWAPLITKCRTGACPAARLAGGLVWSARLNRLVLFGGITGGLPGTTFDDVWTFNGTWTKASVSGVKPSARFLFGMAEDAATGKIVVYGGITSGDTALNDTWLLDPTTMTWSKVTTVATPPSYGEVAMGWSPSLGAVVLSGGSDAGAVMVPNPGTWAFDATARTWVKLTTNTTPSPRKDAALVTDTCHGSAILYGGEDGPVPPTFTDRTWILQ